MRIHLIQRKPRRANFSVEGYFARVLQEFESRGADVHLRIPEQYSNGLIPRLRIARFAQQNQGDITHITGDIHFAALATDPRRTVVTVLDCGRLHQMSGLRREVLRQLWFSRPLRRAGAITTISEETKRDLLTWVPDLDPAKIHVVPVSVSPIFKASPRDFNAENPQVLQVGTKANKNVVRLVRALEGIRCRLRIVGDIPEDLRDALRVARIDFSSTSGITDEQLVNEYEESDIIAFASTLEGFGMPIVEGQLIGRPVVTSETTSMPEVAGDGAVLVDPYSVDSIQVGIKRVIEDDEFRSTLVKRGAVNAQRYKTATIATQYLDIYSALEKASR